MSYLNNTSLGQDLNSRQLNLLETSLAHSNNTQTNEKVPLLFLHSPFTALSLPHRRAYVTNAKGEKVEALTYQVSNGRDTLIINGAADTGLPFGNYPRLFHFYVCSEIKIHQDCKVYFKKSLLEFMRGLKMRGSTNQKKLFYEQIIRFINSTFRIERKNDDGTLSTIFPQQSIVQHNLDPLWAGRGHKEPAYIEFSYDYVKTIIESSVPFHRDAIIALQGSTFSLDLYTWANARSYSLSYTKEKKVLLPYDIVMQQLGTSYKNKRMFVRDLKKSFVEVSLFIPLLKISFLDEGLLLEASASAIKQRENN